MPLRPSYASSFYFTCPTLSLRGPSPPQTHPEDVPITISPFQPLAMHVATCCLLPSHRRSSTLLPRAPGVAVTAHMPRGTTAAGGTPIATTGALKAVPAGHGWHVEDGEGAGGDGRRGVAVGGSGSARELINSMPRLQHLIVSPAASHSEPGSVHQSRACAVRLELPLNSSYNSLPLPLPLPLSFLSAALLSLCRSPSFLTAPLLTHRPSPVSSSLSSLSPPSPLSPPPLLCLPPSPLSPPSPRSPPPFLSLPSLLALPPFLSLPPSYFSPPSPSPPPLATGPRGPPRPPRSRPPCIHRCAPSQHHQLPPSPLTTMRSSRSLPSVLEPTGAIPGTSALLSPSARVGQVASHTADEVTLSTEEARAALSGAALSGAALSGAAPSAADPSGAAPSAAARSATAAYARSAARHNDGASSAASVPGAAHADGAGAAASTAVAAVGDGAYISDNESFVRTDRAAAAAAARGAAPGGDRLGQEAVARIQELSPHGAARCAAEGEREHCCQGEGFAGVSVAKHGGVSVAKHGGVSVAKHGGVSVAKGETGKCGGDLGRPTCGVIDDALPPARDTSSAEDSS
ncbi:unnamed protein product [Closterium sp. NIES-65]|nr:unnamed protein product [Closterium sp. NIES-65]